MPGRDAASCCPRRTGACPLVRQLHARGAVARRDRAVQNTPERAAVNPTEAPRGTNRTSAEHGRGGPLGRFGTQNRRDVHEAPRKPVPYPTRRNVGRTLRTRASAYPKLHVTDSGLDARLLRVTPQRLARLNPTALSEFSHLIETFVVSELHKQSS